VFIGYDQIVFLEKETCTRTIWRGYLNEIVFEAFYYLSRIGIFDLIIHFS